MERETRFQPWLDADEVRQASRVGVFTGLMVFWAAVFAPIYAVLGDNRCTVVLIFGCLCGGAIIVAVRLGTTPRVCGNALVATAFFVYTALAIYCGGRWAPTTIWYLSIPVLSLVVCGTGWACFWTATSLAVITIFTALDHDGVTLPSRLGPSQLLLLHSLGLVGLMLCFFALAYLLLQFEKNARRILREANHWLQLESSLDALTRVANRRCFDKVLEQEWDQHLHNGIPLTLVLFDLDYFKEFNDIYGHLAGDKILRRAAAAIQAGTRCRDDVVARFGGEEFVVILPNTSAQHAPEIVERMCEAIEALSIQHAGSAVSGHVTISAGTATTVPTADQTQFELLRRADEALYRAKAQGRNRAVYAGMLTSDSRGDTVAAPGGRRAEAGCTTATAVDDQPVTVTFVGPVADEFRPLRKWS